MTARDFLPEPYQARMEAVLGPEYSDYLAALEKEPVRGLRANLLKISPGALPGLLETALEPVPWTEGGYYYPEELRPAKHPYYYAGLYYLQEASAMAPAAVLSAKPGERILDLCGAPGGKSTQLGMGLQGQGVLVANDISASRAQAMLKNLELAGIANCYVTAETPERLAERFPAYFDKILVDAPCSGEGMFRREPAMVRDWLSRGPAYYAPLQRQILEQAASMLRPGGYLLYSTCTFSEEEDEENVQELLQACPELTLEPIPLRPGFTSDRLAGTVKLWPQRVDGEGQFLALFRKKASGTEEQPAGTEIPPTTLRQLPKILKKTDFEDFVRKLPSHLASLPLELRGEQLYLLPENSKIIPGLHYLRTGLWLGSIQKGRFTPSQALALALKKEEFPDTVDFALTDERVIRYLKGETISCESASCTGEDGWCLVCVDGFPLGWAKRRSQGLKNKYYPGWRWQ